MEISPYPFSYFMASLKFIFLSIIIFVFNSSKAQLYCGEVELDPNTSINEQLRFTTFTDYIGGITINNVTRLRVKVLDKTIPDPLCSWSLTIVVDNGAGVTPINEWEELADYSGSGNAPNPTILLLQIRVRNSCATGVNNGVWQTFPLGNHADILDIIRPLIVPIAPPAVPGTIIFAGSCISGVNGPGSYLSNYAEYNFNIDIRVKPELTYNPGIYELNLKFLLKENTP